MLQRRGARAITTEFSAAQLTHFGGIALVHQFLQRLCIRTFLSRTIPFRQRNHTYTLSELLLALVYPMLLGLEKIEVAALLQTNGVFQYITGLPSFPNPSTLRRFLIHGAACDLLPQLRDAHDRLRAIFLQRPSTPSSFWLDCDSTVRTLYGHQEGAEVGYNPPHRGARSYHPLLVTEAHRGDTLAGLLRPGNASSAARIEELLDRVLVLLPHHRNLRLRADAGFYDGQFIAQLRQNRVHFVIVAKMTNPLKIAVPGKRYHRVRDDVAVAEFQYRPHGWERAERFVILRRSIPPEPMDVQQTLFTLDRYRYHVLVTDMDLQPYEVFHWYRDRAGIERIIRTLKDDYPFGSAPTNHFAANELYAELSLFAYDLMTWFKRLCLPDDWQSYTLPTIRHRLLMIPGAFVRSKNIPTLRFPKNSMYQDVFVGAQERIAVLDPLV